METSCQIKQRSCQKRQQVAIFFQILLKKLPKHDGMNLVRPLAESGQLAMTHPETPKSKEQRFVTVDRAVEEKT